MTSSHGTALPGLPFGLQARALGIPDASAVYEVVRAAEEHDLGEALIEVEDIVGDWQRPSFDLSLDSLGIFDRQRLVGFAEVSHGSRAEADVHPDHRGRGIGTVLIQWCEQRAREVGAHRIGQTVPARNGGAQSLLRARGYEQLWTSWVLRLRPEDEINGAARPPAGVTVRPYRPGEEPRVHRIIEDAFNEWPNRDPTSFGDWASTVLGRPGFAPWHLLVAEEDGDILGACFLGVSGDNVWVNQLAVRRDQRHRGLARALLVEAFRSGRAHGARTAELSTDSRTGALGLYEHVGMRVTETFVHLALELASPGEPRPEPA
ncbi:MAG: GNAT family N-acetyltransferase [Actinomycetota bacterium]|nr:GNAT family N-acetyltransferase [Actinomycetota bacterium]